MSTPRRPRIALSLGDPNGIGPEIGVKLAARAENRERADIVLYSDPTILAAGERVAGLALGLNDGVRLNIRPFVTAGVLRSKFTINWNKDRGTNLDGSERINDRHFTRAEKQAARGALSERRHD